MSAQFAKPHQLCTGPRSSWQALEEAPTAPEEAPIARSMPTNYRPSSLRLRTRSASVGRARVERTTTSCVESRPETAPVPRARPGVGDSSGTGSGLTEWPMFPLAETRRPAGPLEVVGWRGRSLSISDAVEAGRSVSGLPSGPVQWVLSEVVRERTPLSV